MSCLIPLIVPALAAGLLSLNAAEELKGIPSSRLARLARDWEAGEPKTFDDFWKEMEGKAPLIEAIDGDRQHSLITFLWRGSNDTIRVTMLGGLPGANLLKPMKRLAGTDLWYLTEVHSLEARFQYAFQINGPEALRMEMTAITKALEDNPPRKDPLNPRTCAWGSYVELPHAPAQPWIEKRAGIPSGRTAREKLKSRALHAEYSLSIYTPAGYEQDARRSWLLIAFDGGFNLQEVTLDNLMAAGKIPPLIVIGINNLNSRTRSRDLGCSDEFASFVTAEVVPWGRKTYRVYDDSGHTIVGGISLGGKMAVYCGLKHSDVFGKVLSQSGSFLTAVRQESPTPLWEPEPQGLLAAEFLHSPRLPLEFYLEVGRYETTLLFSPLLETRRLRDVLQAKGYPVTYSEFVGGHNEVCWRGSFADAIMASRRRINRCRLKACLIRLRRTLCSRVVLYGSSPAR
jgi:enterochelin esterase family protein